MSGWPLLVRSDSPAATKEVAGRLAALCASGDVVLLMGDLGAGKTAFAQGFAAALGVEGPVTSPTFALVRQYRCAESAPVATLIHADVYRTGGLGEVVELALAEMVEERAIALVEWGELAAPALGDDALDILLEVPAAATDGSGSDGSGPEERIISITGRGRWTGRADEVGRALGLRSAGVSPRRDDDGGIEHGGSEHGGSEPGDIRSAKVER
jgi:tRNA threonylcarbamoyladenosine biosynthesis protein TsaE